MPPPRTAAPRLVLMLALSVFINYIDRGNLATAAPLIQAEFHLSGTQLGMLLSAFYVTYVLAMTPVGWLAEHYGGKRVLGAGVAIWSAATLLTGLAGGLVSLLLLRLMLGLGESAAFPCTSKILAGALPHTQLGRANGSMSFGYLVGPAVGTFLGGMLMARVGWRPVFLLFGTASLLWLLPWRTVRIAPAAASPAVPAVTAASAGAGPPFASILRERGLWGAALGHFAGNYNFYFVLSWLPFYLVKARGFSMESMAGVVGAAYLVNAGSALTMGWITDWWTRSGRSTSHILKANMALNHVVSIGCMAGLALLPIHGALTCLFVYEVVSGFASPGYFAIPQLMGGPTAAGRWVGVQNTCGNIAGWISPALTGWLVDWTGTFTSAFALAGIVNLLGIVGWVLILPKVAPVDWQARGAARGAAAGSGGAQPAVTSVR